MNGTKEPTRTQIMPLDNGCNWQNLNATTTKKKWKEWSMRMFLDGGKGGKMGSGMGAIAWVIVGIKNAEFFPLGEGGDILQNSGRDMDSFETEIRGPHRLTERANEGTLQRNIIEVIGARKIQCLETIESRAEERTE